MRSNFSVINPSHWKTYEGTKNAVKIGAIKNSLYVVRLEKMPVEVDGEIKYEEKLTIHTLKQHEDEEIEYADESIVMDIFRKVHFY